MASEVSEGQKSGTRWRLEAKKTAKVVKRRRSKVPSASGQIGQHSPSGMMGSAHSDVSSQITSSHMTVPLSQTQIWQGSGFHTSLSLYNCPSSVQLPNVPGRRKELSARWVSTVLHQTAKFMVGRRKDEMRSCKVWRNRKELREWAPKKRFHSTFECRGFLKLCFSCNRDSYSWGLCRFCLLDVSPCNVLTAFWTFIQAKKLFNWNLMINGLLWVTWSFRITRGW